jgi:hypothetical protein
MKVSEELRRDADNLVRGAVFSPQQWRAMADRVQAMEEAIEDVRALAEAAKSWSDPRALTGRVIDALEGLVEPEGKSAPEPESIEVRYERFAAAAKPGVIFVNEYGRRSVIIERDPAHEYQPGVNGYDPPEHGPWYRVEVQWSDAEPSEDCMIWYTIGEPEST